MVSFECCSHLPAMESSVPVRPPATSKKLPSHSLRRFMQSCWTPPPPSQPLPLPPAPPSPFSCLPDDVLIECLVRLPRSSLPCALMVCRKWRSLLKSPEFYQHRLKIGHLDSLLFVFGGSSSGLASAVYCKSDGGWRTGSLFPPRAIVGNEWLVDYHCVEHAQPLLHAQPAVMNHQLYIVGAVPGQNSKTWSQDCTIIYDAWTKSLTRKAPMLCPRKKFACCVIGNRIFVAGGANRRDPSRDALMDAEEYIPEHDEWRPIANMPRKRYGCLGAAVDGIFYVIGGLKSSSVFGMCMQPYTYVSSMDSFDPKTNSWLKTKALPMGGCVIACTVVGSCIYMLSSHAVELSFWNYDTHNDSWTRIKAPPIPSPLRMDNRLKFSCVTVGTSVYIIQVGGSIDDILRRSGRQARNLKEGLVLIYDTLVQEWSRGPDLPCIKSGAVCTVVQC